MKQFHPNRPQTVGDPNPHRRVKIHLGAILSHAWNENTPDNIAGGAQWLLRSLSVTAVGNNSDLKVLRQTDDVLGEILAAQPLQEINV